MEILRTPDERFDGLRDYPFAPNYAEVHATDGAEQFLRIHYLDEAPLDVASGEVVLLLHGEPSWSYLYRHMIPPLAAAGHRCIAAVVAAYDAPFPDEAHLAGARQFPMLVPTSPQDPAAPANRRAWETLARFDRPFLCAFSDGDPITGAGEPVLRARIPGCAKVEHVTIAGGGHFLQEDRGPELAAAIVAFIAAT